jgi:pimeloyl-ACP methyl ester carboxylesterase
MKTFLHTSVFFVLTLLLFSCKKDEPQAIERDLWLRNKGAEMPVWVRGNLASGKLVLFFHGGPGDCAMCYRYYLKGLESEVAVAYWDQRIAGSSAGKVDPKTLTYAQFGEDAALVVNLLKQEFPAADIHLLAHSYGVELAWQFLTTGNNQALVRSLVVVNGTFSTYRWLYQIREWGLREARAQGKTETVAYLLANPVTPENVLTYDWQRLERTVHQLGANPVSVYSDKGFLLNYAFASPNTALAQFTHFKHYGDWSRNEMMRFDKSALLGGIRIPVGLFWGKKDGVVPYEISGETAALLTGTTMREVVFEDSWHEPFLTETDRFVREVLRFVK